MLCSASLSLSLSLSLSDYLTFSYKPSCVRRLPLMPLPRRMQLGFFLKLSTCAFLQSSRRRIPDRANGHWHAGTLGPSPRHHKKHQAYRRFRRWIQRDSDYQDDEIQRTFGSLWRRRSAEFTPGVRSLHVHHGVHQRRCVPSK